MRRYISFLFLFFSCACFCQEKNALVNGLNSQSDTVSFVTTINIKNVTKDGIYLNGYVVNIPYEEAKRLDGKKVRVTGKVEIRKGLKEKNVEKIEQGRNEDAQHITSPKIEIIKN
jgi:hypothetical protein